MTSNGEREFPPAFLRRCIRLEIAPPDDERLAEIVRLRFGDVLESARDLITSFVERSSTANLATDQLLNAVYLATNQRSPLSPAEMDAVLADIFRDLSGPA